MSPSPTHSASAPKLSYLLLRHLSFAIGELTAQGLVLWKDDAGHWYWCWQDTNAQATNGFQALGLAIMDAVTTRFPEAFANQ